ncbi:hypothetical protein BDZ94DRAFT_937677 [Collybia nuda]|uniref:Uncharacterized protein n=1 Tax=Collybia nuda TaxID=64659 RepID=A0A9P6CFL8_9AGAR|nr:hypothetical protein BDZ94DRAFT_937677 [Collybia nuda]
MNVLQANGYDRRPAKEVLVAFTKAINTGEPSGIDEAPELEIIRTVAATLQRHFDRSSELPPWSLTSFEVDFNDSAVIGRGAYGRIVKGKWKDQVGPNEACIEPCTDLAT